MHFESFEEFSNFAIGLITIIVFLIGAALMPDTKKLPPSYRRAIRALHRK